MNLVVEGIDLEELGERGDAVEVDEDATDVEEDAGDAPVTIAMRRRCARPCLRSQSSTSTNP
jgi:hypothetical protein